MNLEPLQDTVRDPKAFETIDDYMRATRAILGFIGSAALTRIVSPTTPNYIFYQYGSAHAHQITRPLNTKLFIEDEQEFSDALRRFFDVLDVVRKATADSVQALERRGLDSHVIDRVTYTVQQSLGSVCDSLRNPNQARKRVGQLFESLVRLIISKVGVACDSRTIKVPLPGYADQHMSYQLDLVLARGTAIVASETEVLSPEAIVGSVKTTSKDRLDKVFLDKFLLSRLLKREVRCFAIFLHDVQRAKKGGNLFGVNTTFKSSHFLGYTIALNPLDGVYYVDPRPVMRQNLDLARMIARFGEFVVRDLWRL